MEIDIEIDKQLVLKGWVLKPQSPVSGAIIIVHGLGEHFGRYSWVCDRFLDNGMAIFGADLPGHGLSPGKRGHIPNFSSINSVIDKMYSLCRSEFPGIEPVLYGHSLGGLLVLNYLYNNRGRFKRYIITSPWLKLSFDPPRFQVILARIISRIMPGLLQPNGLVIEHLSHDPEVVANYKNDSLVHGRISVRLFVNSVITARLILMNASTFSENALILHGEDDKITSPEGSKQFQAAAKNSTIRIWKGGYHELHNEPFKDEVINYILNWIINS